MIAFSNKGKGTRKSKSKNKINFSCGCLIILTIVIVSTAAKPTIDRSERINRTIKDPNDKIIKGQTLKINFTNSDEIKMTVKRMDPINNPNQPVSQILSNDHNHFLLFDKIGQISSSTAYIHVMVPLNISSLVYEAQPIFGQLSRVMAMQTSNISHVSYVKNLQDIALNNRNRIRRGLDRINDVTGTLPIDGTPLSTQIARNPRAWPLLVYYLPAIFKGLFVTAGVAVITYSIATAFIPENKTPVEQIKQEHLTEIEMDLEAVKTVNAEVMKEFDKTMKEAYDLLPQDYKPAFNVSALTPPTLASIFNPELSDKENYETHTELLRSIMKEMQGQVRTLRSHLHVLAPPVLRFTRDYIPNLTPSAEFVDLFLNLQGSDTEPLYLPVADAPEGDFIVDRSKRFLKAMINAASIVGTFLGFLSQAEIAELRSQQTSLTGKHNLLVHANAKQDSSITKIANLMDDVRATIEVYSRFEPAVISNQIDQAVSHWEERLEITIKAIQQLQNHKLSVDYLSLSQMTLLHEKVGELAKETGLQPLPEKLSDYFQIDVSYFRNGKDIMMILHVPCLESTNLLNLYRYLPFPLPLSGFMLTSGRTLKDTLTPDILSKISSDDFPHLPAPRFQDSENVLFVKPETDLIAVNDRQQYRLVTPTDLLHCDKNGLTYLCDEMNALRTDLDHTCLAALFFKESSAISSRCHFDRAPAREEVVQLSTTQFLVYSPSQSRFQIVCSNGTRFTAHMGRVTRITVPMGCAAELGSHLITAPTHYSLQPHATLHPAQLDPLTLPAGLFDEGPYVDLALQLITAGLNTSKARFDQRLQDLTSWTNTSVSTLHQEATLDKEFSDLLVEHLKQPNVLAIVIWSSLSLVLAVIILLTCWGLIKRCRRKPKMTLNECISQLQKMLPPAQEHLRHAMHKVTPDFTEDDSTDEEIRRVFAPRYRSSP